MPSDDRETRFRTRERITRVVVTLGVAAYAVVWVGGEALPEWIRYAIVAVVVAAAIAADAWELGVREVVDPNRWWRLVLLLLIALVGIAWLLLMQ